ncbi:aldo/keto reductase [Roseomonas sp. CCTCC AB2023176]|uniref:aldo/keto reductase n=1 Tax=Roseomonas sp. CCTCC AB2023176 TaxID=3342640 RepID=UPI0035DDDC14
MDRVIETPRLRIPKLGFGTWQLRGAECQAAVESALSLGYRALDTAEMYGNEAEVGAGLRASGLPRDQVFVTSKVWHTNISPDGMRRACETSLSLLGLDALDLYLIHWPAPDMDMDASLGALNRLKEDGLTRAIGVANFPAGMLRRALATGIPIAADQVEYHVTLSQDRLLSVARPAGVVVTAYSPLAKGGLTGDAALRGISDRLGASPAQVALAWLLRQDGVCAIPKSGRAQGQRENLEALDLAGRLTDADVAALDALPKDRRTVSPAFAPDWND